MGLFSRTSDDGNSSVPEYSVNSHFQLPLNFKKNVLIKAGAGVLLVGLVAYSGVHSAANASKPIINSKHANVNLNVSQSSTPQTTDQSNISSGTNSSVSGSTNTGSSTGSSVKVTVNGRNVHVPSNGSAQTTVPSGDGNTSVSVSSNTSSSGQSTNSNNSSTNVNVNSNSYSSSSVDVEDSSQ